MSITQALANATSGLGAVSRQADIASQNIANALTPGFSRRQVSLAEQTIAGQGAGVRVAGVDRAETPALTATRREAQSGAADISARAAAIERIAKIIGGPEDVGSLFRKMSAFQSSLASLANAPDNVAAQHQAASAASSLTQRINDIANAYQGMRATADSAIASTVSALNSHLAALGQLNDQIASAVVGRRDASALLDQRDQLIDRVNDAIPVKPLMRENGRIDLMTTEGVMLFSGAPRQVQFSPAPIIDAGMSVAAGSLSRLSVDGVDITPGISPRASSGGELAGLFSVRDIIAPEAAAELDAFAEDLIARLEASGLDPTLAPGAAGLFTDNGAPLAPPVAAGLASRIALNPAVDPSQGGEVWRLRDGVGALAPGAVGSDLLLRNLIGALDAPVLSALGGGRQMSAIENASALGGAASGRFAGADAELQSAQGLVQSLKDAELSETGVDTDAELQNLLLIEQAYAANARLIETIGHLIDRLMEI